MAGLGQIASILGIDSRTAAAPLLARLTVADSVWHRIERAVGELDSGAAVLWSYGGNWLVIPRSIVPAGSVFLGDWNIVEIGGAVAALLNPIAAASYAATALLNYWLEVRDAEAQNERLRLDALAEARQLVMNACGAGGNPETCRRATEAYNALAASMQSPDPGGGGFWPTAAAGAGGLAVGLLLALFLFSGVGRRRNPSRRRRRYRRAYA